MTVTHTISTTVSQMNLDQRVASSFSSSILTCTRTHMNVHTRACAALSLPGVCDPDALFRYTDSTQICGTHTANVWPHGVGWKHEQDPARLAWEQHLNRDSTAVSAVLGPYQLRVMTNNTDLMLTETEVIYSVCHREARPSKDSDTNTNTRTHTHTTRRI